MQTTSWFDYLRADRDTRLELDRHEAAHREHMAELRQQQVALWNIAAIGVEQVKGLAAIAIGMDGVREDLASLNALFDWRLEQVLQQQQAQTRRLDDLSSILSNPLDTQGQELWRRAQFAAERGWVDEAVETYNAAIEKSPFLYPAHLQLGFIHAYQRLDFAAATRSFTQAARYAERDDAKSAAVAYYQLHKFARESDEFTLAWDHIERTCQLDAKMGSAWWDRATLASQLGKQDAIVPSLDKAIEIDALFWHRANDESWGDVQADVASLLAARKQIAKRQSIATISSLDVWPNLFDEKVRSLFVGPVSQLRKAMPALKEASASDEYAVVVAGFLSAERLAQTTQGSIRTVASAKRPEISETVSRLQDEYGTLKLSAEAASRQAVADNNKRLGTLIISAVIGVFLLWCNIGVLLGDNSIGLTLVGIALLLVCLVLIWENRHPKAKVSAVKSEYDSKLSQKHRDIDNLKQQLLALGALPAWSPSLATTAKSKTP